MNLRRFDEPLVYMTIILWIHIPIRQCLLSESRPRRIWTTETDIKPQWNKKKIVYPMRGTHFTWVRYNRFGHHVSNLVGVIYRLLIYWELFVDHDHISCPYRHMFPTVVISITYHGMTLLSDLCITGARSATTPRIWYFGHSGLTKHVSPECPKSHISSPRTKYGAWIRMQ